MAFRDGLLVFSQAGTLPSAGTGQTRLTASPGLVPVLAPVLVQEPDHLRTRPVQVSAQLRQHLRGHALTLSDETGKRPVVDASCSDSAS